MGLGKSQSSFYKLLKTPATRDLVISFVLTRLESDKRFKFYSSRKTALVDSLNNGSTSVDVTKWEPVVEAMVIIGQRQITSTDRNYISQVALESTTVHNKDIILNLSSIANRVFGDGLVSWLRIIGMAELVTDIAGYTIEKGFLADVKPTLDWWINFIDKVKFGPCNVSIKTWIQRIGGWGVMYAEAEKQRSSPLQFLHADSIVPPDHLPFHSLPGTAAEEQKNLTVPLLVRVSGPESTHDSEYSFGSTSRPQLTPSPNAAPATNNSIPVPRPFSPTNTVNSAFKPNAACSRNPYPNRPLPVTPTLQPDPPRYVVRHNTFSSQLGNIAPQSYGASVRKPLCGNGTSELMSREIPFPRENICRQKAPQQMVGFPNHPLASGNTPMQMSTLKTQSNTLATSHDMSKSFNHPRAAPSDAVSSKHPSEATFNAARDQVLARAVSSSSSSSSGYSGLDVGTFQCRSCAGPKHRGEPSGTGQCKNLHCLIYWCLIGNCRCEFETMASLMDHRNTHKSDPGNRPDLNVCSSCGKGTKQRNELIHKCPNKDCQAHWCLRDQCTLEFGDPSELKAHKERARH